MAKLTPDPAAPDLDPSTRPIPARTQLLAVAWLRWRIFANSFRRPPTTTGQAVGLIFKIILRIIIWPIFAFMVIGPVFASGFFAWDAVAHHHPQRLIPLLAGIFLLWQFISLNGISMAINLSSFDPSSLVRFPLPFGRYLLLRTLFGLLTPSTVVGSLALFAAAIGIGIADHSLALPALITLSVYALMNVFFARMLAAWLERWLSTRRAREIFGALMAFTFIGFQFLNFRRAPTHSKVPQTSWLLNLLHWSAPYLH
jgi:ABC-2 type transport system permease protein